MRRPHHREAHRSDRAAWLRAAVLGSDDAIVSTSSLMIGVGASSASKEAVLIAGVAGLVAGAMSMAVGEYVSVSSQRDAEDADIEIEKEELEADPAAELNELAGIYMKRGLNKDLAMQVAKELTAHGQLEAHLRDELGIEKKKLSRPILAGATSAMSFGLFALLPISAHLLAPPSFRIPIIAAVSIAGLGALGAFGAYLGGAPLGRAALRVMLGGALAMLATDLIGRLFGVAVG